MLAVVVITPPLWFSGCANPNTLMDPNDSYVVVEPVVGTRIKKRILRSELDGYVGIAPTKKTIVTEDTDMMTLPSPRP